MCSRDTSHTCVTEYLINSGNYPKWVGIPK